MQWVKIFSEGAFILQLHFHEILFFIFCTITACEKAGAYKMKNAASQIILPHFYFSVDMSE